MDVPEDRNFPVCDEHAQLLELTDEVNTWSLVEEITLDWLRIAEAWSLPELEELAAVAHEDAKVEYLKARSKVELAAEIADASRRHDARIPAEVKLEEREELIRRRRRSDELNNAYTTLEDLPEGQIREEAREDMLAVLVEERERANREFSEYRRELGLGVRCRRRSKNQRAAWAGPAPSNRVEEFDRAGVLIGAPVFQLPSYKVPGMNNSRSSPPGAAGTKGEKVSEVKLVVLYPTPTDVEEFDRVYAEEHVSLVNEKVPNLSRWTAAKVMGTPTGDAPPYHLVVELYFPSVEALQEAFGTEGGQETAAHAVSISTGGPPVLLVSEEEEQ